MDNLTRGLDALAREEGLKQFTRQVICEARELIKGPRCAVWTEADLVAFAEGWAKLHLERLERVWGDKP